MLTVEHGSTMCVTHGGCYVMILYDVTFNVNVNFKLSNITRCQLPKRLKDLFYCGLVFPCNLSMRFPSHSGLYSNITSYHNYKMCKQLNSLSKVFSVSTSLHSPSPKADTALTLTLYLVPGRSAGRRVEVE